MPTDIEIQSHYLQCSVHWTTLEIQVDSIDDFHNVMSEGLMSEGQISEGQMSEGLMFEDLMSEGLMSEGF